ncbi:hypothetical protein HaLaN_05624 [Haematococcus lacustris]|uniref:Uncharacterized protein n=1 Tax=Haematococcus lacustris TaxID=44745 RepID=A0A699YJQ8_HAELA|nr:hypothetical protein HaLaN_05624 [Haematococcus lacustris]
MQWNVQRFCHMRCSIAQWVGHNQVRLQSKSQTAYIVHPAHGALCGQGDDMGPNHGLSAAVQVPLMTVWFPGFQWKCRQAAKPVELLKPQPGAWHCHTCGRRWADAALDVVWTRSC